MKNKMWYRNTLQYKIKMWFYRLTFQDIINITKKIIVIVLEIIMSFLGFGLLLILPAFFR